MNEDMTKQTKKFSFDKAFQEKIVQALLIDKPWAVQLNEVINVDYFEYAYLKLIVKNHLSYYAKYKEFPSLDLLIGILKEDLKEKHDATLLQQVKDFLKKVKTNEDLGDLPHVKEKALDFCRRAALQNALMDSVELIHSEKYEKIVDLVKKAIHAGNPNSSGLDLFEDIDARYSETYRKTIPTGIQEIDQRKVLNGGLGAGEVGVVVAPPGCGKSHLLVHLGAQAILEGKNVLHYTFELNERAVGIRYDSHLLDIPSLECHDSREHIKEFYQKNNENLGRLMVKYYPTSTASSMTLRGHIEKLATQKFVPDLIIVDYAGIMRSADRHELLRMELKKVVEELRTMANELDLPLWTAVQSNKEGAQSDFVDLTNMAEGYGQAHVADFVVGLSRKSAEKATGFGVLFIAKNRAGVDGIKYKVHLDTAKSKLRILTDAEAKDYSESYDQERDLIRTKLREINQKKQIDTNNVKQ